MKKVRRKDREIPFEEALAVLDSAEYGVLSTSSNDSVPYGVQVSFSFINNNIRTYSWKKVRGVW